MCVCASFDVNIAVTPGSRLEILFENLWTNKLPSNSKTSASLLIWLICQLLKVVLEGIGSVQFSRSVVSDSLRPHESQQV